MKEKKKGLCVVFFYAIYVVGVLVLNSGITVSIESEAGDKLHQ